jgi:hypothetical protein
MDNEFEFVLDKSAGRLAEALDDIESFFANRRRPGDDRHASLAKFLKAVFLATEMNKQMIGHISVAIQKMGGVDLGDLKETAKLKKKVQWLVDELSSYQSMVSKVRAYADGSSDRESAASLLARLNKIRELVG